MDATTICLIVWGVVFIVTLAIEFVTEELISVWFSVGAVPSAILSAFKQIPYWVSIIVFFVVSTISLVIFLRFFRSKILKQGEIKTNSDSLVGQVKTLLPAINDSSIGQIKINDVLYNCRSEDLVEAGQKVKIIGIEGNHLLVKAPETDANNESEVK